MVEQKSRMGQLSRDVFPHFTTVETRWNDNDVYGHINNAVYYFYFDTIVNTYLIDSGALDVGKSNTIGLVAQTGCTYFVPLEFPQILDAGLKVTKIGNSSVIYQIGLFAKESAETAAIGHFVHVYVDRETRRPVQNIDELRTALKPLIA